jgi:3-methyladenine DNA glycosylase/8-oxoguanine DNA glycosylase
VGAHDRPEDFRPDHPLVARLHHRLPGLRIGRANAVLEIIVPTILEQKVAGFESRRAYRQLVQRLGDPAPGPGGLMVPPDASVLASTPYYDLHLLGVERKRADTVRRVAARGKQLETLLELPAPEAGRRLATIRGIGPWTVGEVSLLAFGDPDAVSVGDFHIPHQVVYAFTRDTRGSDERMLELLEPFRGQRGRVIRLITAAGLGPPRRGPRSAGRNIAEM